MRARKGLTILEIVISVGIFALMIGAIAALQSTIFRSNRLAGTRVDIDQRSLSVLRRFTTELRAAQTPHDGGFPIAGATATSVSFYSDTNNDSLIERIRYFIEDGTLKRGSITPSGQPLTYDPAQEAVISMVPNIEIMPPYFLYYDATFDGVTSTTPLTEPITLSAVRVVEMDLHIRTNITSQSTRTLHTRAMLRSLKD